jgi:hypothetical protein
MAKREQTRRAQLRLASLDPALRDHAARTAKAWIHGDGRVTGSVSALKMRVNAVQLLRVQLGEFAHADGDDHKLSRRSGAIATPFRHRPARTTLAGRVRGERPPRRLTARIRNLLTPRAGRASLLAVSIACMLIIAAVVFIGAMRQGRARNGSSPQAVASVPGRESQVRVVRFALVAPDARDVAIVGDFNGWNSRATPMRRTGAAGAWTASCALGAGRHAYAFLVDGHEWRVDPAAPLDPEDSFGIRSSVVVVARAATTLRRAGAIAIALACALLVGTAAALARARRARGSPIGSMAGAALVNAVVDSARAAGLPAGR